MENVAAQLAEVKRLGSVLQSQQRSIEALADARRQRMWRVIVETGMTQADLAKQIGVSTSAVQQALREARQAPLPQFSFETRDVQGRWARELRKRSDLSVKQAADCLDVPQVWVKDVEAGRAVKGVGRLPRLFELYGAKVNRYAVGGAR